MKKKLHEFLEECAEVHRADVLESIYTKDRYACSSIDTKDGWIDIVSYCDGGAYVTVNHDDKKNLRECPLLCEAIEKALPSWAEVKEFYDSDDEEEEADNDFGPSFSSFSSWDDYWRYIFREELED